MVFYIFPFKISDMKGSGNFVKLSQVYILEEPICSEQMEFFGRPFSYSVGLRQAALNNLNLLRKNSQLCPV